MGEKRQGFPVMSDQGLHRGPISDAPLNVNDPTRCGWRAVDGVRDPSFTELSDLHRAERNEQQQGQDLCAHDS